MMKWIQSGGKVQVDARTLMLEKLLRIYNDDKSTTKDQANRYLGYIHLVSQIDESAPYFRADSSEVRSLAKRQFFGSAEFEFGQLLNEFIESAIADYQYAYEEADARAERVFRKKIDQLISEIDATKPEIVKTSGIKGQVIFVSNTDLINKAMLSLPKLLDIGDELKAKVKKLNKNDVQVRGGKRESVLHKYAERKKLTPHSNGESQATPQETGAPGSRVQEATIVEEEPGIDDRLGTDIHSEGYKET